MCQWVNDFGSWAVFRSQLVCNPSSGCDRGDSDAGCNCGGLTYESFDDEKRARRHHLYDTNVCVIVVIVVVIIISAAAASVASLITRRHLNTLSKPFWKRRKIITCPPVLFAVLYLICLLECVWQKTCFLGLRLPIGFQKWWFDILTASSLRDVFKASAIKTLLILLKILVFLIDCGTCYSYFIIYLGDIFYRFC